MSATESADSGRKRMRRGSRKNNSKSTADFWGSADKLPPVADVTVTTDASAVLRSLGRPPFWGHEAVSEYYLRAVYDNTVKLAEVLATAGDLLSDPTEQRN